MPMYLFGDNSAMAGNEIEMIRNLEHKKWMRMIWDYDCQSDHLTNYIPVVLALSSSGLETKSFPVQHRCRELFNVLQHTFSRVINEVLWYPLQAPAPYVCAPIAGNL